METKGVSGRPMSSREDQGHVGKTKVILGRLKVISGRPRSSQKNQVRLGQTKVISRRPRSSQKDQGRIMQTKVVHGHTRVHVTERRILARLPVFPPSTNLSV